MKRAAAPPSLRRHLMLNLLLPAAALALVLGAGGVALIANVVDSAHDRLLDGSILAIAERVTSEDDAVTVDLPPVALGMLESQAHDSIYYAIVYDGVAVTGYHDLPLAAADLAAGESRHWNAIYRGNRVRIGAQARRIYGKPNPVLIAVAETTYARDAQEWRMFGGLAVLECGLLGMVGLLAWRAVGHGLAPLTRLSDQIDRRTVEGASSLNPLDVTGVPREAMAPAMALNALLARLGQSVQAVQRFTADASHQMRTPLAVLRTHAQLVRRHGSHSKIGQDALDDIDGAVIRLERLTKQMLSLARVEAEAEGGPAADHADLGRLAARIIADHLPQAVAAGIDVQFECPGQAVPVIGNPVLIEQIVGNLLDNAIRYNRRGGAVTIAVTPDCDGVTLRIEDDGPGIPAAERGRVFDRFYRILASGGPSGSGLGLAIVRSVADHLGATVALGDRPQGPGLAVTVRLRPGPAGSAP